MQPGHEGEGRFEFCLVLGRTRWVSWKADSQIAAPCLANVWNGAEACANAHRPWRMQTGTARWQRAAPVAQQKEDVIREDMHELQAWFPPAWTTQCNRCYLSLSLSLSPYLLWMAAWAKDRVRPTSPVGHPAAGARHQIGCKKRARGSPRAWPQSVADPEHRGDLKPGKKTRSDSASGERPSGPSAGPRCWSRAADREVSRMSRRTIRRPVAVAGGPTSVPGGHVGARERALVGQQLGLHGWFWIAPGPEGTRRVQAEWAESMLRWTHVRADAATALYSTATQRTRRWCRCTRSML
ncbi:uncharacterized protein BJ171DRAFT_473928 [Polychytrium aggregatum]|uniref:uncharacterized protein n=1 Tax=Polychytrium aggregatum TaxID=110093 RepID=UPI0022FE2F66|nr:uncharacterized protein BJ171DRAFT_473928 [Polychytrium aggregatum]KAI9205917.1 hypothetical protein BJ171DRAFT_473928 [Polychytrium aggregatum]